MNHLTQSLRRLAAAALVLLSLPVFSQLSGTYTINPSGTGTTNYASFSAAVTALTTSGVSGPVTFNVAAGTYSEQIVIGAITGSSATNHVTFQKAPTATGAAVLTFAATSTANYTVRLTAASNLTFKNLTLANTTVSGQTVGGIVEYGGSTSNIQFINNTFNGNAGINSSNAWGAIRWGSVPSSGYGIGVWKFIGNTFNNISYAVNINGSALINADSVIVQNNTINCSYFHVYTNYAKNVVATNNTMNTTTGGIGYNQVLYPSTTVVFSNNTMSGMAYGFASFVSSNSTSALNYTINNNTMTSSPIASTNYGIVIGGSSTAANAISLVTIKNNNISLNGTSSSWGIHTAYVNSAVATPSEISNNMIAIVAPATATAYGFFPSHVANMNVVHNTFSVVGGSPTAGRGVYVNRNTSATTFTVGGLNMRNNIISNVGPGYAVEIASTANTAAMLGTISNNAYQGNAVNPFRNGTTNFTTLPAWQTAVNNDKGSVFGTIVFFSNQDLHVQSGLPNNMADPAFSTTQDIDGQTRSTTTPDIGADEYTPKTCIEATLFNAATVSATTANVSWTTTNQPIGFRVRFRKENTNAWVSFATTSGSTTLTGLQPNSTYQVQVSEKCSTTDTSLWSAAVLTFTTNAAVNYFEAFTGATNLPTSWSRAQGQIGQPTSFTATTSAWGVGNFGNVAGGLGNGVSARVNLWSTNHRNWLISPPIEIPNAPNNLITLEYDIALTTFGGVAATALGVDDTLSLVVSLDNGATWNKSNSIKTYTSASTILPTGQHDSLVVPSLWLGKTIKLAWYSQSTVTNADNYVFIDNFSVAYSTTCASENQCEFTVNMTDAFGDGWNGNTIKFVQNGVTVGTVGAGFTTGLNSTANIRLCGSDSVRVVVGTLGTWTNEVGFTVVAPDGVVLLTRVPATYTATALLGKFKATCLSPNCPVSDSLIVPSVQVCKGEVAVFSATPAKSSNTTIWMNSASRVLKSGNTFTTPADTMTVAYKVAVYADNNQSSHVKFGPPATLAGGFGNFTNGTWFTALKAMSLDSITVRSNGPATFKVRTSVAQGSIASGNSGALLQESQWITVNSAGTHRVPVNLKFTPGTYFMNFTWATGSGLLHRATGGAVYPYLVSGVARVDSVQFGTATSQTRAYYAYDWIVSEGCISPISNTSAVRVPTPSTSLPYSENFNGGLSCNWTKSSTSAQNWSVVSNIGGSSLNGSSFAALNDDAAGANSPAVNATLLSPVVSTLGYDSLILSFSHYYRHFIDQAGIVEAFNGTSWVVLDSFFSNKGSWTAPAVQSYNVTALANADFQVRFRFNDKLGKWGWYWAIDNFTINGNLIPCTNVRVEVKTDIYGSEVTWSLVDVNTGATWATGGPYADVSPYNAAAATHIDTLCLPNNGTFEFRINDSFGDGLFDGTNTGTFTVDKLCSWGWNNVITGSGALPYGSATNPPSYDSVVFDMNCVQTKNVTFNVDMNQVTQSFTTPEVNGLWNNWCGNCNPLTDANGDGIWTTTLPLPVGTTQEYKFSADAWTIQEQNNPAAPCTNGNATYTNRVIVIPANDTVLNVVCWSQCTACDVDVTLKVNMAWEVANNAISANGVHVAGDFQGWNPATTPMTDANNDGIYEVMINVPANSSIQYKFINGNAWGQDEPVPSACAVTGTTNRGATFAYGDSTMSPVCFGKCTDCAVGLVESLQNVSLFPNPTRGLFNLARADAATEVEVSVLDLQGKVLTVAKWNDGVETLSIDLSSFANGVYMVRMTSEEGSRTMRVSVQK